MNALKPKHLNFLPWNIFSLTRVKEQLKSGPGMLGRQSWLQGLTSHQDEAASTVRCCSISSTAAAQRWLIAVKYL